ncbi:MAG: peptidase M50 [Candidatus Aminicenantes bacterium RBG_16_63_16]|nr:MAG: peptidase M50 [Candidatus Aminicenantes bacterium RBG_16_63_16]
MFGRSITLVRLFGFEVKIDLSWLILGLLIAWTLAQGSFPNSYGGLEPAVYWAMGVAAAIGLLISIVFHELWHSLIARKFGLPMKGITLFIFGGVAEMTEEPPSPKAEFFMAAAGPISSIVLGAALVGVSAFARSSGWPKPVIGVSNYLGFLNLMLAGFNLIPAFPLDGGRVLRAVLWGWKDNLRWATRVASSIGSGFGMILVLIGAVQFVFGNLVGGIWLFLIGMFLRGASRSALTQLTIQQALRGERVSKYMKNDPVTVPAEISVREFVDDYILKHHFKMFPVVDGGRLAGCATLNQVRGVPRDEWGRRTVADLARACSIENTIAADDQVLNALSLMSRTNASRLIVVDGERLVGVITLKDIMKVLSLKADLEDEA